MGDASRFDGRTASAAEIMHRAALMPGRSIGELVEIAGLDVTSDRRTKGRVGAAVEAYFGMKADSIPLPDFRVAGIELKSVPLRPRDQEIAVKERLFISSIDYHALSAEEWDTASVRPKLEKVLLVFYGWEPRAPLGEFVISDVVLWEPDGEFMRTVRRDWEAVRDLVREGHAERISESLGSVLVAATKGPGGPHDRRQPNSSVLAARRAWAIRPAVLRSLLERDRAGRALTFEVSTTLADGALQALSRLAGSTIRQVEHRLGLRATRAKHRAKLVLDAALASTPGPGTRGLLESGVDVRAVVVDSSRWPYEALSFPSFRYQELIREDWPDSELLARLDRFIFVPITGAKGLPSLEEAVVGLPVAWSPTEAELAGMASEWTMFRDEIAAGHALHLTPASRTTYLHVRPKGRDGLDTDPAPIVGPVVRKCFWFNKGFVARILRQDGQS